MLNNSPILSSVYINFYCCKLLRSYIVQNARFLPSPDQRKNKFDFSNRKMCSKRNTLNRKYKKSSNFSREVLKKTLVNNVIREAMWLLLGARIYYTYIAKTEYLANNINLPQVIVSASTKINISLFSNVECNVA